MIYHVTVKGFDSGLNELLAAQQRKYDSRVKRMRVCNPEKAKNDKLCIKAIWRDLHGVHINAPIELFYHVYAKDKRHDRPNIGYAFCKSFLDALQTCKVIQNDSWDWVINTHFEYDIDKENPRVEVEIRVKE